MSINEFPLPDVGEGLTEAEIVSWKVKVGDQIKVNDVVVEIETAKSLVELPSPYAGTVTAIHVPEGETVPVGTPIISVDDGVAGEDKPAAATPIGEIDPLNPAASGGGENQTLVGYGPRSGSALRRVGQRGVLSWARGARRSRLSPSTARAAAISRRVSQGSMTASMNPRSAAM